MQPSRSVVVSSDRAAPSAGGWEGRYAATAAALPGLARSARRTLLGFSAFVDACARLDDCAQIFAADAPPAARALAADLLGRVRQGIGGEIGLDWPDGDRWLAGSVPHHLGAGGTSAQIAKALALTGAPTLLALADRSAGQLAVLHDGIGLASGSLASGGRVVPLGTVVADESGAKPRHWIFEATEGTQVAGVSVRRSTRVIVRLRDDAPEDDPDFAALSVPLAAECGAAAISSLVSTPEAWLAGTLDRIGNLVRGWRDAGLGTVHLELADYGDRPAMPLVILGALRCAVTSVGMSRSEWAAIVGGEPTAAALRDLAESLALERVCVHADDWALSVTRGDPAREMAALLTGSLLASARAAAGRPVVPDALPSGALLGPAPEAAPLGGGWSAVGCPAPYLTRPASTIGLGDTFLAGTLLVLGQPAGTPFAPFDQGDRA
ncbi:MAG: ADP-dependent glucokinase/phosphofructokinase [Amaricoccus sp.]|uniref:hypothetical protein n=1 Tax=Amaricoccus sp. TaxID=1872485 RepID=UPI0039E426D0